MQESKYRVAVPVGVWLIDTRLIPRQTSVQSERVMWNDTDTPLAYFISFRAYGTWLHGDKRGSIDRFNNRYRAPHIQASDKWHYYNEQRLRSEPLILKAMKQAPPSVSARLTAAQPGGLTSAPP